MTCGCRSLPAAATLLVLTSTAVLSGQQAQTPTPPPGAGPGSSRAVAQGFSVVLVLADLQASTAQDDVPPAARRALADMKDFLPYKSYKLLDAAWLLGQATSGSATRLRGPDDQEYELRMHTYPIRSMGMGAQETPASSRSSAVNVRFTLVESSPREAEVEAVVAEQSRRSRLEELRQDVERLEAELGQVRRRLTSPENTTKARELEAQLANARQRLATYTRSQSPSVKTRTASAKSGPVIDTTFTMDVGETVVVGTSRLKGNSRALIALLTAVPSKGSRTPMADER